jgi:hypothetical protein
LRLQLPHCCCLQQTFIARRHANRTWLQTWSAAYHDNISHKHARCAEAHRDVTSKLKCDDAWHSGTPNLHSNCSNESNIEYHDSTSWCDTSSKSFRGCYA